MLMIAFIIVSIKYSITLKDSAKTAVENGVDADDYDIMRFGLWFYIIPPILAFFAPFIFQLSLLPLLMIPYAPSIYYGLKISRKLDKGYDYVRKLNNKIDQVVWIGFAGIGLVILNGIIILTNVLTRGL